MWRIAHRGASGHAPENTLAAFRLAVEMGAPFIETDLQLTRDARIVAMHDAVVDRTTNGRGRVGGMSLADLRRLDAGAWYLSEDGRSFAGERIPTLDEILQFARETDVAFYLELKPSQSWGMEYSVAGALQASSALARTVVVSTDPGVLLAVRRVEPAIMTGLLAERPDPKSIEKALSIGARQILVRAGSATPELVAAIHRQDLRVVAWTVNEPSEMQSVAAAGVDGIITDYPDRLAEVLPD